MPRSPYQFNPSFKPHSIRGMNKAAVRDYVRDALSHYHYTDQDSCEMQGGFLKRVEILDITGARFYSSSSWVNICAAMNFSDFPDTVILNLDGAISLHKLEPLGIWGTITNLISSAQRVFSILSAIGTVFSIDELVKPLANLGDKLKLSAGAVGERLVGVIEAYQRGAAWIDKVLHIDTIWKTHQISRIVSKEYDAFWVEQEKALAGMSERIFGNTEQLQSYIHLMELYFETALRFAGSSADEARTEGLKHGAELTERSRTFLKEYEADPSKVYADLMSYTFGKANTFISKEQKLQDADLVSFVANLGTEVQEVQTRLDGIDALTTAIQKTGLVDLKRSLTDFTSTVDSIFSKNVLPAIKKLNLYVDENERLIKEIEARRLEEELDRKRSVLLTTPPDDLNDTERKMQARQVSALFKSSISPSDDVGKNFRSDIDKIVAEIFNE